ncbi:hypothetical protein [Variovorax paradoxus]|uniref:hypothetical protein n=1 Tax=Variovorax paradoxus TaxID=34073 RepID=UPI0012DA4A30|nr:hypothetical protein [Variovorax paradoxus]
MTESRNAKAAADAADDSCRSTNCSRARTPSSPRSAADSPQWRAHLAAAGASPLDLKPWWQ